MNKKKFDKKIFIVIIVSSIIFVIAAAFLFLPINTKQFVADECVVTSNEICQGKSDEPIATICLYKRDFECYKTARCEIQSDGKCGWTKDTRLNLCLMAN